MALILDLSAITRVAVQRKGKGAKLAYVKDDETFQGWNVGDTLNLTTEAESYNDECRSIIVRMVADNGNVPSKERTKMVAFQAALIKEMRTLHGEDFDLIGGYALHEGDAIWYATRTA